MSLLAPAARLLDWAVALRRVSAGYRQADGGRRPQLFCPRRYTEKIQWRKLSDLNPAYAVLSDKLAARDFIAARIGPDLLVPILWAGADPDAVPWGQLTPPYVVKSTHTSGDVLVVPAGAAPWAPAMRELVRAWLRHGYLETEPAYTLLPQRVVIEPLFLTPAGTPPPELRLFTFDGRVRIINTVRVEEGKVRHAAFHTVEGRRLDWHFTRPPLPVELPPPDALRCMIDAAERISAGFDHLRVDFYYPGDRVFVGEVTVYPWSGLSRFAPDRADFELGAYWTIQTPLRRAGWTLLRRRRQIPYVS